jgi:anti-anti-sigma factor
MMLNLIIQKLGDVTVFRCVGRITSDDADRLGKAFLGQPDMRIAVLDLAEITAVDAAGLGVIVSLRQWAKATGRRLKLMNLRPRVAELFELTNLTPEFEACSVSDMFDLICRATENRVVVPDAAGDRSGTAQDQHHWNEHRKSPAA